MLSKPELASFLIGLVKANDADLVNEDAVLSDEICAPEDRTAIRRLRDLVQRLYADFDYLVSPEFELMATGKSDAYRAMLQILEQCRGTERTTAKVRRRCIYTIV